MRDKLQSVKFPDDTVKMRDVEILRCTKKYHVIYLGLHEFIKFSVFNERKIFKKIKSTTLLKNVINELQESELGDKFKHD